MLKKTLLLIICPLLIMAEALVFSEECFMVSGDTASPCMTYDLKAEKIAGLTDSALIMFSDPEQYFNSQYTKYCNDFLAQRDLFKKFPDAASLHRQFTYEIADIPFSNKRFYSLRFQRSWFTGGAHPNSNADHWIIRKKDAKILNFNDIFKSDAKPALKELIDKTLLKAYKINDLEEILFNKDYKVSEDVYLVKKGIVFQYDAYEIAPYYVGPIEVLLPYIKIHKLLKDF